MKKDKQRAQRKAQQKTDRKKAEKAVKAALITELTAVISTFATPNKKLKKIIEKSSSAFAKEIDKTAKPVVEEVSAKAEETTTVAPVKKATKASGIKKTEKAATK